MSTSQAIPPSILHGPSLADETGCGALTLGDYAKEVAHRFADRECAVAGDIRWTYDELWRQSRAVAKALAASGAGKGSRIGILQTNTPHFLASLFGTALIGGVATTISTFFTPPELAAVLDMSCCSHLLMDDRVLKKDYQLILRQLTDFPVGSASGEIAAPTFPYLRHVVVIGAAGTEQPYESWDSFLARGALIPDALIDAMAEAVSPADPAVLFFSSGSTGKAKGIVSAHRGVCLQLWRWAKWYRIDQPPRTWAANGFFWSGNFAMALGGTLSTGGCLILQRWFDADDALHLMEQERVTLLIAWPHQWSQLVDADSYASADLSSLRYIDRTSPLASHATVQSDWRQPSDAFGSTETFTLITEPVWAPDETGSAMSHGVPTAGSTLKIVDPVTGDIVPRGTRGEIAVKGPTLMLGYLGTPLSDTLDDAGFLRTGDGGYIDDRGRLVWEGRLNDIIKTGGANVSPLEVDEVIRRHPAVKVTQTVGLPDELLGELVVSCVIPFDGATPSAEELQHYAKQQLASYKVPRKILFFEDGAFSTTGSAKIKLDELRKLAAARLTVSA